MIFAFEKLSNVDYDRKGDVKVKRPHSNELEPEARSRKFQESIFFFNQCVFDGCTGSLKCGCVGGAHHRLKAVNVILRCAERSFR